ncbi:MAG TPA: four helix bundle protein [Chitinophagales bacterium]|nr:four helix bundle protein [Chitinophagales bacterium]HNA65769.1 four helix bundle protein [Saprospiraceae bacterium]HNF69987.1 four helix bundle protein [Chitinophagales bacterium]HNJ88244.1 four helix bundle protein [Chitinophagales bacterium]HNK98030.1 four helix bundle protein [Chitinophagales bacterium]
MERDLVKRIRNFAYNVYRHLKSVRLNFYNRQIMQQLLDSSFSAAANYRAAQRAKSRKDALNKIKIALEEMDESNFWITSLYDLDESTSSDMQALIKESNELTSILVAIISKMG